MTGFHYACMHGHVKIFELLIKKSVECNIDLNAKDSAGRTGFHHACICGHVKIVDLVIKKSVECDINLNVKEDVGGKTGYKWSSQKIDTR